MTDQGRLVSPAYPSALHTMENTGRMTVCGAVARGLRVLDLRTFMGMEAGDSLPVCLSCYRMINQ